jgi:DNA-binding CsgD family transcriptional regulator
MRHALESLTSRQRAVLMLLGEGLRPAGIARGLDVSKQTISFHLTRVMRKLGSKSQEELLVCAVLLRRSTDESEPHSSSEQE